LHPHRLRAESDLLVDLRPGRFGTTEDVDDLDIDVGVAADTVDLRWVDRNDPVATVLQNSDDPVTRSGRIRRGSDDRESAAAVEEAVRDLRDSVVRG
jgi:hypothetical protein